MSLANLMQAHLTRAALDKSMIYTNRIDHYVLI